MFVVPEDRAFTTPLVPMLATAILLLDHVPAPGEEVNEPDEPTQTAVGPEIGAGTGFTVILALPDMVTLQVVTGLVATTV